MMNAIITTHQIYVRYEANAGFLQGSALNVGGMMLNSLPTRYAILPMLSLMRLHKQMPSKIIIDNTAVNS